MNIFLPYAKANTMIFKNSHEWIENNKKKREEEKEYE